MLKPVQSFSLIAIVFISLFGCEKKDLSCDTEILMTGSYGLKKVTECRQR